MRLFKRCPHSNVRCVHGDEIGRTAKGWFRFKFARVICLDCDRALYDRDLLDICTETNQPHPTHKRGKWSWAL